MPAKVELPSRPNPAVADVSSSYSPRRGRPVLFQISVPGTLQPLFPFLLALHTNPGTMDETMTKTKTVVPTYGGFVEFVWPDDLTSVSASHSTGAFLTPDFGLASGSDKATVDGTSSGRKNSMAWERQEDLLEVFHNNGVVFDGDGLPAIRGKVLMIFDRGIYVGYFTTFQVEETDDKAWTFELSWEFKAEETILEFPSLVTTIGSEAFASPSATSPDPSPAPAPPLFPSSPVAPSEGPSFSTPPFNNIA